ncbi:hypothetical protein [Kineosporia sp. R_H_3]|uniref:hypothetical protein n=1 Tax=Kineosporia sp. R_H_3 TaxID=1961848 RepID=UPI001E6346F8|nr:hypothetical protein [Kineosporia sp. R_H_3]
MPLLERSRELPGAEPGEPGPQTDVGLQRLLRLQADEVLDGADDVAVDPLEQQLAGQQGTVERGVAQGRRRGQDDAPTAPAAAGSSWPSAS